MKPLHYVAALSYLLLIISGSWYFGSYSRAQMTREESLKAFKENVKKATAGMTQKQAEEYVKMAGLTPGKELN